MARDVGSGQVQLELTISGDEDGNVDDGVVASLFDELRELIPSADVSRKRAAVPKSAKSGVAFSICQLIVAASASGGVLATLVSAIQAWVLRQHGHSISIELDGDKLEIHGASSSEQARLINTWVEKHAAKT
jgi:Effector Associated Constant Component 1